MKASIKPSPPPGRTKVHKQGTVLEVEISRSNNYDELIVRLDQMFDFNGDLIARKSDWLIIYRDFGKRLIRVGDDPWLAFCWLAREIFICTKDEVEKLTLHSRTNGELVIGEGANANDFNFAPNVALISGEELEKRVLARKMTWKMRSLKI